MRGSRGWKSRDEPIHGLRPEPAPTLPPSEILARARSVHFVLERTGAPEYLDFARTRMLRRVEGDVVQPDRLQGVVRVFSLGAITEIRVLRISDRAWIALSGVGRWEELTPERGVVIDPRVFFDAERGPPAQMARASLPRSGWRPSRSIRRESPVDRIFSSGGGVREEGACLRKAAGWIPGARFPLRDSSAL